MGRDCRDVLHGSLSLPEGGGLTAPGLWALFLVAYFAATTVVNGFGVHAQFRMPVNVFIAFAVCSMLGAERGWGKVKSN